MDCCRKAMETSLVGLNSYRHIKALTNAVLPPFLKPNEHKEMRIFDNYLGMKEFLLKKIQPSCCNKLFRKNLIGESKVIVVQQFLRQ